jgi:hypothetical protein
MQKQELYLEKLGTAAGHLIEAYRQLNAICETLPDPQEFDFEIRTLENLVYGHGRTMSLLFAIEQKITQSIK